MATPSSDSIVTDSAADDFDGNVELISNFTTQRVRMFAQVYILTYVLHRNN